MRKISAREITNVVAELCIEANINLRADVVKAIAAALRRENNLRARRILGTLLENADCARSFKLAICQDTGLPDVFAQVGQDVQIFGGDFLGAVNKGIELGYKRGGLRNSIVTQPLKRQVKPAFSPGVVHVDIVRGKHLDLTVLPKGFGCENKSAVRMFKPTADTDTLKKFVLGVVNAAGADACPPFVIGVGIGGGLDQAALLAKKALLVPLGRPNPQRPLANLEKELLREINQLGIGPLGLGGSTTALGVHIITCPTHIAGLPLAVNISCHALRSAARRI